MRSYAPPGCAVESRSDGTMVDVGFNPRPPRVTCLATPVCVTGHCPGDPGQAPRPAPARQHWAFAMPGPYLPTPVHNVARHAPCITQLRVDRDRRRTNCELLT